MGCAASDVSSRLGISVAAVRSEKGAVRAVPPDEARSAGLARWARSAGGAPVLPGSLVVVGGETGCGGVLGRAG